MDRAAQLNNVRIAAASAAVTGSVLAVDEAAGRVDVLLDTGGVREGVPASDVAAMLSGEDCVAEQDLMWVTFCNSEVRLAAPMRAIGFARTQELGRQLAERGEVLRGASVLKRLMQRSKSGGTRTTVYVVRARHLHCVSMIRLRAHAWCVV